jgi:predicted amidohydrolase
MSDKIRLGLAQCVARFGEREVENLDTAVRMIESASALDVDLLCFAENFPGPFTELNRYEVAEAIHSAAAEFGVAVAYGTSLSDPDRPGSYNIATVVVDEHGDVRGRYLRTHPVGPYIYREGPDWNFDYVESDSFPVIEMSWGKLAISICSEVHLPEVSRILALKGAELCLYPSGLLIDELGYTETWRTLVRARAIENHMYTATLVNIMDQSVADGFAAGSDGRPRGVTRGIGMICSPELVLAESAELGILTADLDLGRIRELRATDEELVVPAPYRTIPGHMKWRRPELYGLLSQPQDG